MCVYNRVSFFDGKAHNLTIDQTNSFTRHDMICTFIRKFRSKYQSEHGHNILHLAVLPTTRLSSVVSRCRYHKASPSSPSRCLPGGAQRQVENARSSRVESPEGGGMRWNVDACMNIEIQAMQSETATQGKKGMHKSPIGVILYE